MSDSVQGVELFRAETNLTDVLNLIWSEEIDIGQKIKRCETVLTEHTKKQRRLPLEGLRYAGDDVDHKKAGEGVCSEEGFCSTDSTCIVA